MNQIQTQISEKHPKAIEAEARAETHRTNRSEAQKHRARERRAINQACVQHGVRFFRTGDYTICYRTAQHGNRTPGQIIELSTALRSPKDPADNHMGRVVALERFAAGHRVLLKNPYYSQLNTVGFLQQLLGGV